MSFNDMGPVRPSKRLKAVFWTLVVLVVAIIGITTWKSWGAPLFEKVGNINPIEKIVQAIPTQQTTNQPSSPDTGEQPVQSGDNLTVVRVCGPSFGA